jgi:hypothetical protein
VRFAQPVEKTAERKPTMKSNTQLTGVAGVLTQRTPCGIYDEQSGRRYSNIIDSEGAVPLTTIS